MNLNKVAKSNVEQEKNIELDGYLNKGIRWVNLNIFDWKSL